MTAIQPTATATLTRRQQRRHRRHTDSHADADSYADCYPDATPTATPTPTVQVTVQTTPAGLVSPLTALPYSSTQTFSWVPGSSHTIATTSPQSGGTGVQYLWTSWSDNGAISHTVAPTTNTTYTATFRTQFYLTMIHGTGGTVSPASGWKNSGAIVSITATPTNLSGLQFQPLDRQRHRFLLWDEQSGLNHNEWTDYGERCVYSESCSGDCADKSRRS